MRGGRAGCGPGRRPTGSRGFTLIEILLGTIIVFLAILVPAIALNLQLQIIVVLLGLLIIAAGVWRLTSKILPNEQRYLALRAKADGSVDRTRVLNAQGVRLRTEDTEAAREDTGKRSTPSTPQWTGWRRSRGGRADRSLERGGGAASPPPGPVRGGSGTCRTDLVRAREAQKDGPNLR